MMKNAFRFTLFAALLLVAALVPMKAAFAVDPPPPQTSVFLSGHIYYGDCQDPAGGLFYHVYNGPNWFHDDYTLADGSYTPGYLYPNTYTTITIYDQPFGILLYRESFMTPADPFISWEKDIYLPDHQEQ